MIIHFDLFGNTLRNLWFHRVVFIQHRTAFRTPNVQKDRRFRTRVGHRACAAQQRSAAGMRCLRVLLRAAEVTACSSHPRAVRRHRLARRAEHGPDLSSQPLENRMVLCSGRA